MKEIFASFEKSLQRLREILGEEKTVANRDSAIKRFEFTVELAWKCVQKFLREQEIICRSPKECLKEAFKFGLIEDDPKWFEMMKDRNLTVHTYNETTAEEVYNRLPNYLEIFESLKEKLDQFQKEL
ncbi:MAG: nucleotidyltransferase substrate binding protein [Candidatus Pacebacteria bacterium]|nr:nucleotidyltransferase substrate binding protein [Candidatus Paceibacterota bacterium]